MHEVLRSYNVLAVPSEDGHYCVSVASEPSPCPDPDEDVSDLPLEELVRLRGGFTMTADHLRELTGC